ncbi:hypothetical protein ACGFLS_30820 [Streptomyces abikoensis]|uniref:hypothetical protein n=1 Tax=Streptomyces abikoensis TaxID=97398 RepID=UPI00370FE252
MADEIKVKDSPLAAWMLEKALANPTIPKVDDEARGAIRVAAALILEKGTGAVDIDGVVSTLGVTLAEIEAEADKHR